MSQATLQAANPAPAAAVELDLLHGFEARHDGRVLELPFAAQRVIAFLALRPRPVQRAHVAGTLWIDSTEAHAQAALRTTLWRLRRHAGGLVATTANTLALSGEVSVDVRNTAERARRILQHQGMPQAADVAVLSSAGDLLPDWYDDWLTIERERFRQLRLLALDVLCEDLCAQGCYADAVVAGLASVAAEPLRESAHRALIRAHLTAGNPGEARREYGLFRGLLHDQLGVAPSAGLRALVGDP
jgi:DNA-binding SARP family transcriptional activator